MLRTIFVPLDGSPVAARAVHYAGALAGVTGAHLLLCLAAWRPSSPGAVAAAAHRPPGEARRAYLDGLVAALAADGIAAEAELAPEVGAGLIEAVRRRRPDLVVMGATAGPWRGRDDRATEHLLHTLAIPVLLVPPVEEHPWLLDQVLQVGWNPWDLPASIAAGEAAGAVHD